MYIFLAILAFGVLIGIHELGHFVAARIFDVKVNEFAFGMGPKILHKQGKETLYSLRLLPFGGFCAMEGEDGDSADPRAFTQKSAWKRAIILFAGAAMNFLLGFLMILIIAPQTRFIEPIIADFAEGCPYESADGFQAGDRILRVDGHRIYFTDNFSEYMARGGDDHNIVLLRDGRRVTLRNYHMPKVPYPTEDGGTVMMYGLRFAAGEHEFWRDLRCSWYQALDFVRLIWRSLGDLVRGAVSVKDLSGPVGIVSYVNEVEAGAESTEEARFNFFFIFSLIAVNLAVMNLLPLPALDGGRIFLLLVTWLIEHIFRRKLDPKYEGYIHTAGFVLLMGLMVFVLFNDVIKILKG